MGFSAIVSSYTTQSGSLQSQVATAVNTALNASEGTITAAANWSSSAIDGHAFAVVRSGTIIAVRCLKSISTTTLTYYRLYDETNTEIPTDVQVGDTIVLYERPQVVGAGTALGSVAGIALYTQGSGSGQVNDFNAGANGILVSGFLQLSDYERIAFSTTAPIPQIDATAGGHIMLGRYRTINGVTSLAARTLVHCARANSNQPVIRTSSTSKGDWFGGTIFVNNGTIATTAGGPGFSVYDKDCVLVGTSAIAQIRLSSTADLIYGLTIDNALVALLAAATAGGVRSKTCDAAFGLSSATPSNVFMNVPRPVFKSGNNVDVTFWSSKWVRVINCASGTDFIVGGGNVSATTLNRGLTEVRQDAVLSIVDQAGTGLAARYFCQDTDNGQRLAANVIGTNPSYLADNTYEGVTIAGAAVISNMLLGAARQNTANVSVDRFTGIVWDYRGLDNDNTDRFLFLIAAYGYQPAAQISVLKGTTAASVTRALLADVNITQANPATVAAYTEIGNLDRLYDRAALWLTEAGANMEHVGGGNYLITADGSDLDLGSHNLVIDATAASAFAVNTGTNTVTIKASQLLAGATFSKIVTTGTIAFANGATPGPALIYRDASGTSVPVTAPNIISGSRVQIFNVTDNVELANAVLTGAGYAGRFTWTVDKTIRLRAIYCAGTSARREVEATATLGNTGAIFLSAQSDDTIYNSYAIDGATVTEFAPDYPNVQVDVSDPDSVTTVQRLYAWWVANLATANGIRNFFGGVTAEDESNIRVNTGIINLTLDNVSGGPVRITGARLYRSDGTTVIAAGSGSIQIDPGKAYLADTAALNANIIAARDAARLAAALSA
jgi:hypothetical protein